MKNTKKLLALLLALAMVLSLVACGGGSTSSTPSSTPASNPTSSTPGGDEENTTPLVVGYDYFSSKFSPFFASSAYDQDAEAMTQIGLLVTDRAGGVILNGIEGETVNYNGTDYTYHGPANFVITQNDDGTVYYDITLREDIVFSDGTPMTIDDVIFSMYVLCDPTYDGSSTLYAVKIEGMKAYRSGMEARWSLIFKAGNEGYVENEYYTAEQYDAFWAAFEQAGDLFVQEIVDYCAPYGATNVNEAASLWGYDGMLPENATNADWFDVIVETFGLNLSSDNGINYESAGSSIESLTLSLLSDEYMAGVTTGESAPNISGIQKTGDYSMRVVCTEFEATAIYQLGLEIAPLHYYGDASLYDYDNNSFGFPKGDLSSVRAKTTQPMGAGAYKFLKFENGVIYYEANENYYLGAPKTKYINFQEVAESDKLNGVLTGSLDVTDPSISQDVAAAIKEANKSDSLTGDVVTTSLVNNLGYGYIGINSENVCVGGDPASDASKALRKAFGTIYSVYRDVAIDSYYGELASVINYPISDTSWAAPRPTDDGYQIAFSVDVNGNDIYTSDMDSEAKYAAAIQAALGFFEAAGYTVENGQVVAAPEGASLEYEVMIPGGGVGDHPSFMVLKLASDAFATIGINLIVNDLSNSNDLWDGLDAGTVEMWCAAWGATIDPDMYQIYYSDVANGGANAGGSTGYYEIRDEELDQLIMDARQSADQTFRKAMYKACLDIVIDWACEIPVYQRQNCVIFSTERVNMATMTPDITTFYSWMGDIQNIEMN